MHHFNLPDSVPYYNFIWHRERQLRVQLHGYLHPPRRKAGMLHYIYDQAREDCGIIICILILITNYIYFQFQNIFLQVRVYKDNIFSTRQEILAGVGVKCIK